MDDKIKLLIQKRDAYNNTVRYFYEKIKGIRTIGEVQSALSRLRMMYSKYEDVQSELETLGEASMTDRQQFEDGYGVVESSLLDKLDNFQKPVSLHQNILDKLDSIENVAKLDSSKLNENKSIQFKLPDVPLVKFDGDRLKWLSFRDVFVNVIHSNDRVSNVEKFYYLHGSLKDGSAYRLIETIPITEDNYLTAWEKLYEHYNNEFAIQQHHVRCIYDIKKPNENSHTSLNSFIEIIENNLQALQALNINQDNWSLFMNHHIIEKLDALSKFEILKKLPLDRLTPTTKLLSLLKERVRLLENLTSHKLSDKSHAQNQNNKPFAKSSRVLNTTSVSCIYCHDGEHKLSNCNKFLDKGVSPSTRFDFVKKNNLCTNCLAPNHRVIDCSSSNCRKCNMKHHTSLHFQKSNQNKNFVSFKTPNQSNSNVCSAPSGLESSTGDQIVSKSQDQKRSDNRNSKSTSYVSNVLATVENTESELTDTILATVLLWVQSDKGYRVQCRALIDSGSQRNFITERISQLISATKRSINHPVSGFSGHVSYIKHVANLNIQSRCTNFCRDLQFLIVPKICGNLPTSNINLDQLNCNLNMLPNRIKLADPLFYKSEIVDMLIGVELFNEILLPGTYILNKQLPLFRNSHLGYLVFGKLKFQSSSLPYKCQTNLEIDAKPPNVELNNLIQRFWQVDQLPINPRMCWSKSEKICEDLYEQNTIRLDSGRYSVSLPVKPNINSLGLSQNSALQQFKYLENRLNNNPDLKIQYKNFMTEYSDLGHMEEVVKPELNDNQYDKTYFLPHHAVFKESSTTTKVRVVFNASSKTTSQLSLNDVLYSGPTIQHDLFLILIRFRAHLIGLSADITKMYRQIEIHPNQRDLHRIYWRDNQDDDIKCYRLKTVTYGTTSAPFLAIRTLFKLADDEIDKYPEASHILKRDFYVDDALTGSDSIECASKIKNDIVSLLDSGGFELRKWASNCSILRDNLSSTSNIISVLGLSWDTECDSFCVKIVSSENTVLSKRTILSEIAQLYDPIGFISPIIVVAKQIMQKLWTISDIGWDDPLPSDIVDLWKTFKSQLSVLDSFKIPRCIKSSVSNIFEIHAFGDASEKAFGSVVYIRTMGSDNQFTVRLLCSKSKIAPLKVQTIPRLELCAALLTAELVAKVLIVFENIVTNIFYWTDSEITLARIKSQLESNQTKLPIFEANRVSKIQDLSSVDNWYYVPTHFNPADIVSRGSLATELIDCSIWWNGPDFLYMDKSQWPNQKVVIDLNPDSNSSVTLVTKVNEINSSKFDLLTRYSKLFKLIRVTAYCRRFIDHCRSKTIRKNVGMLSTSEVDDAFKSVIKLSQRFEFLTEIQKLSKNEFVSTKSKLKSFCPVLDKDGIVRVGGRLNNSDYDYDKKHPIVLSGSCHLSKLITEYEHIKLKHAGPQQLLYSIRQRFWILNGRNLCKSVVHKCLQCFRVSPRSIEQFMGQLPSERITPSRPFHHVGLDFCGPFSMKYPIRSNVKTKAYICVFICFVTRACHLELVGDLTTQSFLASFRRFTSRRGRCAHVYSDNGTNFIGAKGELIELQKLFDSEVHKMSVNDFCTENAISWHNIPPRSPHFGGLWEAAVKVAKTHIKRVVGDTCFTWEELNTLVVEIEGCMNSRPLSPMSNDPSDFEVLSPSHFLIGTTMTALPDPCLSHLNYNRLKHYQQIQFLLQKFWKRWQNEVLSEMQERNKWYKEPISLRVGMLVLLKEPNVPPLKWITARIIKLIPGKDNIVRAVQVKTPNSIFERAIAKVCILPIDDVSLNKLNCLKEIIDKDN